MQRDTIAYFNSNDGTSFLAIGRSRFLRAEPSSNDALNRLDNFVAENQGNFIVTALAYDLKNELENLSSHNVDGTDFPSLIAWTPEYFIEIEGDKYEFRSGPPDEFSMEILDRFIHIDDEFTHDLPPVQMLSRTSKSEYLRHVKELKHEIQKGNIYEVNYCQEYYSEQVTLKQPFETYHRLNEITRAPFSVFLQFDEFNVFCGSPERFLEKTGNTLISQPIKGTIKRGRTVAEDEQLKEQLRNDPKERSENVMIVDLVRNDLSKIATVNSVTVDELFGIYSFRTVHQMISTISCQVEDVSFADIVKATFPMGSMTGAPKISAMQLIDKHEEFKRGLYSGSIGYIQPNGDFDLNVVIRTMIYNQKKRYLSCPVGGAITISSDPEKEYEECETKIRKILDGMNA